MQSLQEHFYEYFTVFLFQSYTNFESLFNQICNKSSLSQSVFLTFCVEVAFQCSSFFSLFDFINQINTYLNPTEGSTGCLVLYPCVGHVWCFLKRQECFASVQAVIWHSVSNKTCFFPLEIKSESGCYLCLHLENLFYSLLTLTITYTQAFLYDTPWIETLY